MRQCMEEVKMLLKSKIQCIWIDTYEEAEVEKDLIEICADLNYKLKSWSHTNGLQKVALSPKEKEEPADQKINTERIFREIGAASMKGKGKDEIKDEAIWIIKDLHLLNDAHLVKRIIRDIKEKKTYSYNPIIVVAPVLTIPIEHEKLFTVITYDTPSKEEIEKHVNRTVLTMKKGNEQNGKSFVIPTDEEKKHIVDAFLGLTMNQIKDTIMKSLVKYNSLEIKAIMDEKIQLVQKSGVLDYILPRANFDEIGGNYDLKKWIGEVEESMTDEAVAFGCRRPNGYLAVGIPGCARRKCFI